MKNLKVLGAHLKTLQLSELVYHQVLPSLPPKPLGTGVSARFMFTVYTTLLAHVAAVSLLVPPTDRPALTR